MADSGRWASWTSGREQLATNDTLPEHYSALALLQQLDHVWFHDNLLKPRVCHTDAFSPSSHGLSPYQSVELTSATHSKCASSLLSQHPRSGKLPSARFEPTSITHTHVTTPISGHENSEKRQQHILDLDHQLHLPLQLSDALVSEQSVEAGKQLRVSMVERKLPRATRSVAGSERLWRMSSRNMSVSEFDELQGFMDLGFHVSQDDLTPPPRIARVFPALLWNELEEDGYSDWNSRTAAIKAEQDYVAAWLVHRSASPLQQWRAPATREDMKEHLKFWARAVASTVRQEC